MSMSDQEYIEKREKIFSLLLEVSDSLVAKFFDPDSEKMLNEKIEVLTFWSCTLRKGHNGIEEVIE